MTEISINVDHLKNVEDRCMLEGAIGYIVYLEEEIGKGKFKTVEDLSHKLSDDGCRASGALSHHFVDKLKVIGAVSGFLDFFEEAEKT